MQTFSATSSPVVQPFGSAEEAWFWSQKPQSDSPPITRPCDPMQLFMMVERLYRQRHLTLDHLHVMRFYGQRQKRPNPGLRQEKRAHFLWVDAMRRLHAVFEKNGVVKSHFQRALIDLSLERAMKGHDHA